MMFIMTEPRALFEFGAMNVMINNGTFVFIFWKKNFMVIFGNKFADLNNISEKKLIKKKK